MPIEQLILQELVCRESCTPNREEQDVQLVAFRLHVRQLAEQRRHWEEVEFRYCPDGHVREQIVVP